MGGVQAIPVESILPQQILNGELALVSVTIITYASLLHFTDEVEYIWKRKFTLITWLYLFSKYSVWLSQTLQLLSFVSVLPLESLRACNDSAILEKVLVLLTLIGQQGLLSVLTYALCQGYRPMTVALFITLSISIILQIYLATVEACSLTVSVSEWTLNTITLPLIKSVSSILLDVLALIGVIHQIRGFWNLKRINNKGFVTSLLQQGILLISVVIFIATAATVIGNFTNEPTDGRRISLVLINFDAAFFSAAFSIFQAALSPILICEFTLTLRRQNTPKSIHGPSDLGTLGMPLFQSSPVQSIRSLLGHLHEGIVAEIREGDDLIDIDDFTYSGETDKTYNMVRMI